MIREIMLKRKLAAGFFYSYLLILPILGFGDVTKIKHMRDIEPFIQEDSWIVFDLDNTLFTPDLKDLKTLKKNQKATDPHYYQLERKLGYRRAVDKWNKTVQSGVTMTTLEVNVPQWIAELQQEGHKTLGLTAREPVLEKETREELGKLGIDLERNPVTHSPPTLFSSELPDFPEPAFYAHGIFYVGRGYGAIHHKGKRFLRFLKDFNLSHPSHVIFVDDRKEHVFGMDAELKDAGIPFDGFVYLAIEAE